MPEDWKSGMIAWAACNGSVAELWLFGSRGPKGGARPDSDVDVGLVLIPATGDHDWALGNYAALGERDNDGAEDPPKVGIMQDVITSRVLRGSDLVPTSWQDLRSAPRMKCTRRKAPVTTAMHTQ
jgi:hypothetical protein